MLDANRKLTFTVASLARIMALCELHGQYMEARDMDASDEVLRRSEVDLRGAGLREDELTELNELVGVELNRIEEGVT